MSETAVHVTTLKQWKSVLDIWFKNGYSWYSGRQKYHKSYFNSGSRYLFLDNDNNILKSLSNDEEPYIEYSDFISQQKEDNKMATYYVTQEQYDLLEELKSHSLPFFSLVCSTTEEMKELAHKIPDELDSKVIRYIGGDETIEFKVKEQLYRLWAIDQCGAKVYFKKGRNIWSTTVTEFTSNVFEAPLEEIKKWQTPAWEIEEVKE